MPGQSGESVRHGRRDNEQVAFRCLHKPISHQYLRTAAEQIEELGAEPVAVWLRAGYTVGEGDPDDAERAAGLGGVGEQANGGDVRAPEHGHVAVIDDDGVCWHGHDEPPAPDIYERGT